VVVQRLSRIAVAAKVKPEDAAPQPRSAKAIAAAAEAFTARRKANGLAA